MTTPLAEAVRVLADGVGVPVSTKVPNDEDRWPNTNGRPPTFLKVVRTGGGRGYGGDHMLLAVECWAATSVDAEALALLANDVLAASPNRSDVISRWCDDSGATITSYDDPDITGQSRWLITGTLHCLI